MTSAVPHHVAWSAQPSQFARFQKQGSDSMIVVVQEPHVSLLGSSKQQPTKPNPSCDCGVGCGCGAGVGAGVGANGDTSLSPHHLPLQSSSQLASDQEQWSDSGCQPLSQTLHQSSALDQLQQSPKDVGAAVADRVVSGSREAPGFVSSLSAAAALKVSRSASLGSPMGIFTNWLRIDRTALRLTNLDMKFTGTS